MLERMKNVLKNRKAEGDKGFSLVELAVVIVIIGILVAIAVPVFSGMQDAAKQANVDAAAANGSSIAAAGYANGKNNAEIQTELDALAGDNDNVGSIVLSNDGTPADISNYCVTANETAAEGETPASGMSAEKGPGC